MVNLGPFFPEGTPTLTWEWDNPLAYFNLGGLILSILLLRSLSARRDDSGLANGGWMASLVFAIGTGLHFIGDVIGVAEAWDHQFIHLVVLVALLAFFWKARNVD
ncbi:MAG: hypothetical protein V4510_09590 [bacterium]